MRQPDSAPDQPRPARDLEAERQDLLAAMERAIPDDLLAALRAAQAARSAGKSTARISISLKGGSDASQK
jgi:hypothetical protein